MKIQPILAFAAAMVLSFAAHAHDCSGGAAGGMDATGNQCSDEGAYSQTSMTGAPAASSAVALGTEHARNSSAATFKPVAANTNKASQHAAKKHSHRAAKKQNATAG